MLVTTAKRDSALLKFYMLGPQIEPPDPTQYVEATLQTAPYE